MVTVKPITLQTAILVSVISAELNVNSLVYGIWQTVLFRKDD
jgi:hypothetical protein